MAYEYHPSSLFRRRRFALIICVATSLHGTLGGEIAWAEISGLTRLATGYRSPIFVTHAPGDPDRLFVVERGGSIKIIDRETGASQGTFLTIPDSEAPSSGNGEYGLLGMAFHPDYQANGKFYVHVTVDNNILPFQGASADFSSHIREYTADSSVSASVESMREIFQAVQPQRNHNAGWIGFSPTDGYLYLAFGDGGGSNDNDPGHTLGVGNAQDVTDNPHGKILRIDVSRDDFPDDDERNYAIPASNPFVSGPLAEGDDEIWAYGLRNPWRASFDRATGDLWIGDVGQSAREEIDFQPDGAAGRNYGWRLREGDVTTPGSSGGDRPDGAVDPIYDYPSDGSGAFGGNAVVGGYVYRGPDPEVQGRYFFGDSFPSQLWTFDPADPDGTVANVESTLAPNAGSLGTPVSFGEDAVGNLYVVDLDGDVFRIETNALIAGDYNADGQADGFDFLAWQRGASPEPLSASDLDSWEANFGAISQSARASTIVPEPSAWITALCVATTVFVYHRLTLARPNEVR